MSSSHSHPDKIGPWKLGKTLGRGATGRVHLGIHTQTGQKAAVKVVLKSELHDDTETPAGQLAYGIEREIIIMKLLAHPNVLRLYDVWETSKALYLVLEYVEGGELFDLLVERGPLPEHEAVKYFRQIVLGTAYCHALGICHRDLKPENLLLDASLNVKLADFGMAALESGGKLLETSCGLPHYAAPEIVSGLKYHGAALDVWSCGVILFALLTGRLPFDDENIRNLLLKVQAGTFVVPPELSPEAADLVCRMLTVDPAARIATADVLLHLLLAKYPIPNDDLVSVRLLPHPLTAHKLLGLAKNIDRAILHNLAVLWHDRPEEDIVECLLADGPNPEKTFYALLLRYRHSDTDAASPRRIPRLASRSTPRHSRTRPVSFQRRYGARTRALAASSATALPLRLPLKSPRKRYSQRAPVQRNIYNEIVESQKHADTRRNTDRHPESDMWEDRNRHYADEAPHRYYDNGRNGQNGQNGQNGPVGVSDSAMSLPPTLPSKDSIYASTATPATPAFEHDGKRGDFSGPTGEMDSRLELAAKPDSDAAPLPSLAAAAKLNTVSKLRSVRRRSVRQSLSGLKRNSITVKLLSTYAKLASESDWEYMDKQTKRTLATFATLCDKIFNHELYDQSDEKLEDAEDKRAREYEQLMEAERRKHEAELRARRELARQKRRRSRRLLLLLRKLHITVTEDGPGKEGEKGKSSTDNAEAGAAGNTDEGGAGALANSPTTNTSPLVQPKRQSRGSALRAISEGGAELTHADLEVIKRRLATQPVRRRTPILSRRPVSRLDPLWAASGTEALDRAQDAFNEEFELRRRKRESMISVTEGQRLSKDSEYEAQLFRLPEHEKAGLDLSEEYLGEIRKLRLLNSQQNLAAAAASRREDRKTLIGSVHIPRVTRKLSRFSASNKRLLILTMRLTKESYRDLNSFLDAHVGESDEEDNNDIDNDNGKFDTNKNNLGNEDVENGDSAPQGMPQLCTSFADRLDRAGALADDADDADEPADAASVLDFDDHLAKKRLSYYAGSHARDNGSVRNRPAQNDDYTFNDDDNAPAAQPDVFDSIKLPQNSRAAPPQPQPASMLLPEPQARPKLPTKPYGQVQPKQPLEDSTNLKAEQGQKRKGSFFRKLSWGQRKEEPGQLPSPADSRPASIERKGSFFRWFSGPTPPDIKRYRTILPKHDMLTALYALLNSWSNFGLKSLRRDSAGYNITGAISSNNLFNMRSCKFRIKVALRDNDRKSELICAHVKGSQATADTLFAEIHKVLQKEGVMDD